jgi:hypothetical protein
LPTVSFRGAPADDLVFDPVILHVDAARKMNDIDWSYKNARRKHVACIFSRSRYPRLSTLQFLLSR